jgi:membrane protein involved in colicin uptake
MKTPASNLLRSTLAVLFVICACSAAQAEEGKQPKAVPPGVLKKYDANQDGVLDESEKAAMEADKAKKKAEMEAKRLQKFDTNKDGKLDESEIAAEKAAKAEAAAKKKAEMEKKKVEKEAAGATP